MNNKVFQHTLHKELWNWLADNPDKQKNDWFMWRRNGGDIGYTVRNCFACECALDEDFLQVYCPWCPINWNSKRCDDKNALFRLWSESNDLSERSLLARQIANLPLKKGVITE